MTLRQWQQTLKPLKDMIVQASTTDEVDGLRSFPIGYSWVFVDMVKDMFKTRQSTHGDHRPHVSLGGIQIGTHDLLVYCGIDPMTDLPRRKEPPNRTSIVQTLQRNGIHNTQLPPREYLLMLPRFKFVISPEGRGIDTHRTYEALIAGCIPVLEDHPNSRSKYGNCPVVWTSDAYATITPCFLESEYVKMLDKPYDFSSLIMSSYPLRMQKEIKRSGDFWVKNYMDALWYATNTPQVKSIWYGDAGVVPSQTVSASGYPTPVEPPDIPTPGYPEVVVLRKRTTSRVLMVVLTTIAVVVLVTCLVAALWYIMSKTHDDADIGENIYRD